MSREDAEAWGRAIAQWVRRFQEEAYAELDSLRWWVRRHYRLLPTDERYLALTDEEIRVEYWLHALTARRVQAEKEGLSAETLDDLLSGATVEEKMAKIDAERGWDARPHTIPPDEREPMIRWKADEHG